MLLYLAVFSAAAVNDVVWTKYIAAVSGHKALAAGLWATGTILLGAFGIVSYTADHFALIPAAAGAFVGTYFTVRWMS